MKFRRIYIPVLIFVCTVFTARAQEAYVGTVTVFSEDGDKFTLFMNEDQKNSTPDSKVFAENIIDLKVLFRIVFENKAIATIKKSEFRYGKNCTYIITKNWRKEKVLKIQNCIDLFPGVPGGPAPDGTSPDGTSTTLGPPATAPAQLSASYANGTITLNDGRTLTVNKVKANGMTYPRVLMSTPVDAKVVITYDGNSEQFSGEIPFQYEVKDFQNNNNFFKLTVDEGGPEKTWHVKLQNSNGYDLKIE